MHACVHACVCVQQGVWMVGKMVLMTTMVLIVPEQEWGDVVFVRELV